MWPLVGQFDQAKQVRAVEVVAGEYPPRRCGNRSGSVIHGGYRRVLARNACGSETLSNNSIASFLSLVT